MIRYVSGDTYDFFNRKYRKTFRRNGWKTLEDWEYKKIIKKVNEAIAKELIHNGKSISLGPHIGTIRYEIVSRKLNTSNMLKIDFGESKKRRKEIIERGGTPYKSFRDENNKIIGNNGGEKWLCYYDNDYCRAIWSQTSFGKVLFKLMSFETLHYVKKKILTPFMRENPEAASLIYARTKDSL